MATQCTASSRDKALSKKPTPRRSYRSASGRYFDWAAIIQQSRRNPGVWWLVAASVPATVLQHIRYRRHPALRFPDGRLQGQGRNAHDADGQRRVDLYVRLITTTESETP